MDNLEKIFERASIQQIRSFILSGDRALELETGTQQERADRACRYASAFFERKFPDMKEFDEIFQEVVNYVCVVENAYMEVGMQVGMLLASQILPTIIARST